MSSTKKLNNKIVDQRLIDDLRKIKRIGNYINAHAPIEWICLVCQYQWKTKPCYVLNDDKTGCPQCSKRIKLTDQIIDQRLINRNIKRIGNFNKNNKIKIDWKCLICCFEWNAIPGDILNKKSGCPKCANNIKLSNFQIDQRLLKYNLPIKRIDDYISTHINIKWLCLNKQCNYIWSTKPNNIFSSKSGCPKCNLPGYHEKLIFDLLKNNNIKFLYQFNIKNLSKKYPNYKIDFLIDNIAIEYNGIQHYQLTSFGENFEKSKQKFKKQLLRDQKIREICLLHNIKLIEIDGRKFKHNKLVNLLYDIIRKYINGTKNS